MEKVLVSASFAACWQEGKPISHCSSHGLGCSLVQAIHCKKIRQKPHIAAHLATTCLVVG